MQGEWLRIGVDGLVPIHWEVSKADGGPGTLEGWASVYNVVDLQDDIVVPGAFKKTLQEWRASKRTIPLMADHDHSSEGVIGSLKSATETSYGLRFVAEFASTDKAQNLRTLAKEGHLTGLSIFGPIFKKAFEMRDGRELRLLQELGLMELSMTPFGANQQALVTAAKSGLITLPGDNLPDAWVADMRAALAITIAPARKAAVDLLVAAQYGKPAEAPVDDKAGDKDGTTDQGVTNDDASSYALSVIGESGPSKGSPGGEPSDSLADLLASVEAPSLSAELDALAAEIGEVSHVPGNPESVGG